MPPDNEVERRRDAVDVATKIQSLNDAVGHLGKDVKEDVGLTRKIYNELHDKNGLFIRMKVAEGTIVNTAKAIENHKAAHKWWRQNIARYSIYVAGSGVLATIIYLIKTM